MTQHSSDHEAVESWTDYRRSFANRAVHFPELGPIVPLIDRIVEQGFASSLYASSSLNNLVISDASHWSKKENRILVIPRTSGFELRLYMHGELVERQEFCSWERLYAEVDRLLPKLLQEAKRA